ncbi:MAG: hypothetical protein ACLQDV_00875 [Candidatus Binataceae bacterium]
MLITAIAFEVLLAYLVHKFLPQILQGLLWLATAAILLFWAVKDRDAFIGAMAVGTAIYGGYVMRKWYEQRAAQRHPSI